jgi:predicted nuclease with TOPRIM domain
MSENTNKENSTLKPLTFWQSIRHNLLSDPLSNLPSLVFMSVAIFGIATFVSFFITDLLILPFLIIATLSSLFAMWHIRLLGSLKEQIDQLATENNKLTKENIKFLENNQLLSQQINQFSTENTYLSNNLDKMEQTITQLKINNDQLHVELQALQTLRGHLENYAQETKLDFSKILDETNQSFQRLERVTMENERALLHRIAQDLEFLDHQPKMSKDEYQRFVARIPSHLSQTFLQMGNTTFSDLAGDDQYIDHHEIKALVQSVMDNKSQAVV